jgi:UDP:flavonoid glycosyltransferase YjiC (YdhE family)
MGKRIVLTTYGSLGDLHPYMAIALELKKRGHQAVIATNQVYRSNVQAEGIEFYPVRPDVSFLKTEQGKEIIRRAMDPNEGIKYVIRELVLPNLRESYSDLMQAVQGADLLLTHPITFAGPIVAQETGIRWVSSVLAPISLLSVFDPPIMSTDSGGNLKAFGPLINGALFWLGKRSLRSWSEPIRQLRAELGLAPAINPLFEGQHSPDLVLALFSQVFSRQQPDWPKQTCVAGFVFYDRKSAETGLELELSQFLNAGSPPIVFTLGSSAVHDAGEFYIESAIAAQKLGYRAILLTGGDPSNVPRSLLSENIVAFDYAPYSQLFPRAAAIVHQGGIGTTAQALRAGRPMLVMPYSHDQPDNAARAERLGVARMINRANYTALQVAAELKYLLNEPKYTQRAADIGRQIQAEKGARAACDAIEARLMMPVQAEADEVLPSRG